MTAFLLLNFAVIDVVGNGNWVRLCIGATDYRNRMRTVVILNANWDRSSATIEVVSVKSIESYIRVARKDVGTFVVHRLGLHLGDGLMCRASVNKVIEAVLYKW